MMCIDGKGIRRVYRGSVRRNRTAILICMLLLPLLCFIYMTPLARTPYPISMADCVVSTFEPFFLHFLLIPLSAVLVYLLTEQAERGVYAIRCTSRRSIYMGHVLCVVLVSLALALYSMLCALAMGSLFAIDWINWDTFNSNYYITTWTLNADVRFGSVVAISLYSAFFSMLFVNLMALAIRLVFKNPVFGYMYMMGIGGWNLTVRQYPLITGWLSIRYASFLTPGNFTVGGILCSAAAMALLVLGGALFEKKDFFKF